MNGPPPDVDLGRVWISVAAQVWHRRPGRLERVATRLLRSPGLARALLTTPSLLLPWLIASVVVLAAGAAATLSSGQPVTALLAPAVAAAAIAHRPVPAATPTLADLVATATARASPDTAVIGTSQPNAMPAAAAENADAASPSAVLMTKMASTRARSTIRSLTAMLIESS